MRAEANQRLDDEAASGGLNPERLISAIRRRWKLILAAVLLAGLLSSMTVLLLPNRYDAAAVVQVDPRRKNVSNIENVTTELGSDTASIESETEIIRSRSITLKVIERLDLRSDPELAGPSLGKKLLGAIGFASTTPAIDPRGPVTAPPPAPHGGEAPDDVQADTAPAAAADTAGAAPPVDLARDEVAAAFEDRLKVARVRNTLLIEIRYSSRDPVKAARIANAVAEVYIAEQLAAKAETARTASRLLEQRLGELRVQVSEAERRVEQFRAENGIFAAEGQVLSEKELARTMEQTVLARAATSEARARYEQARRLVESGKGIADLGPVLESHTVRLMKEKHADATRRRAELATRYGPRHPELIKADAEVADTRAGLEREIARLLNNLETDFKQAAARESELVSDLDSRKVQETISKSASVALKDLEREAEASRQLYEALLARYKQTTETEDLQLPDARIVESAAVPLHPASPKRKQIVMIALAGGLAAGLGLVLALEFATLGIGRPEDVESALELEHLSSLPLIIRNRNAPDDPLAATRLMIAAPASAFAEAIRAVRREIDIRRQAPGCRVLLVAASLPGEGGSVVASNLAHHMALSGERVLLLDADMRRANLTRQLAPERPAGLAEVLAGSARLDQAILRDTLTGLHFMPASGVLAAHSSHPPEMLGSAEFARTIATLRQHFGTILIDAPPLLPVIDTRVIADHADQILFVMAWRRTPKQLARRALKSLAVNEEKLIGVVVNQVAPDVLADEQGFVGGEPDRGFPANAAA